MPTEKIRDDVSCSFGNDLGPDVLTHIDQLTPDWLTARLQHNGFLFSGRVTDVRQVKAVQTPSSHMWHIAISSLYVPVNEVGRISPKIWLPQLEYAIAAVQDLDSLGL